MKRFIFSMLFALFAFTSFAMTDEVKKEKHDNTEQTVKAVSVDFVDVVNHKKQFKANTDAVLIDNSVVLYWKMWQHYFYSENLSENYNLKFKDQVFYGADIKIRN